jgi:hypothetical protein
MAFRFALLVTALLSTTSESKAEDAPPSVSEFRERVSIAIDDAKTVSADVGPMVRPPVILGVDGRNLPPTVMPKMLIAEMGPFLAESSATVLVGADGNQADCHSEGVRIRRGDWSALSPETTMTLDLCDHLRQSIKFRHAINVRGEPIANLVQLSITFSRMKPVLVPPPIPIEILASTSGHALGKNGKWIDVNWWAGRFAVQNPDWSAALSSLKVIPKNATVGVMLNLSAKMGYGYIDSCKIELSSDIPQLDTATCDTLTKTLYNENGASRVYNSTESFPVLVSWDRKNPTMTWPALPTVPHMPKDVPLLQADFPNSAVPTQHAIPMNISLDSDGHPSGCEVIRSSGADAWDAAGCRIALEKARFTAARDWFGRPVRGLYEAIADWDAKVIRPAR